MRPPGCSCLARLNPSPAATTSSPQLLKHMLKEFVGTLAHAHPRTASKRGAARAVDSRSQDMSCVALVCSHESDIVTRRACKIAVDSRDIGQQLPLFRTQLHGLRTATPTEFIVSTCFFGQKPCTSRNTVPCQIRIAHQYSSRGACDTNSTQTSEVNKAGLSFRSQRTPCQAVSRAQTRTQQTSLFAQRSRIHSSGKHERMGNTLHAFFWFTSDANSQDQKDKRLRTVRGIHEKDPHSACYEI